MSKILNLITRWLCSLNEKENVSNIVSFCSKRFKTTWKSLRIIEQLFHALSLFLSSINPYKCLQTVQLNCLNSFNNGVLWCQYTFIYDPHTIICDEKTLFSRFLLISNSEPGFSILQCTVIWLACSNIAQHNSL